MIEKDYDDLPLSELFERFQESNYERLEQALQKIDNDLYIAIDDVDVHYYIMKEDGMFGIKLYDLTKKCDIPKQNIEKSMMRKIRKIVRAYQ
ncbi:hypothetical protein KG091_04520 [Carnobacteriaceae bacterium zg-ZUI78]|nr:hypothetical protein [Carnobacteriaceae bacterium zg-ZUI78]